MQIKESMRKPNKKGCLPTEDVYLQHDRPLLCRHGCEEAIPHKCKDEFYGEQISDGVTDPRIKE